MPAPSITASRTARHALPFLFPGQTQKEAFVNEALVRLDALVQPVALAELPEPPPNPATGDCYIVASPATGAWQDHDGELATWAETVWIFARPTEGARVHDAANGGLAVYTLGHGWRRAPGPELPAGGTTQDSEARDAIAEIVTKLHTLGIFSA